MKNLKSYEELVKETNEILIEKLSILQQAVGNYTAAKAAEDYATAEADEADYTVADIVSVKDAYNAKVAYAAAHAASMDAVNAKVVCLNAHAAVKVAQEAVDNVDSVDVLPKL